MMITNNLFLDRIVDELQMTILKDRDSTGQDLFNRVADQVILSEDPENAWVRAGRPALDPNSFKFMDTIQDGFVQALYELAFRNRDEIVDLAMEYAASDSSA